MIKYLYLSLLALIIASCSSNQKQEATTVAVDSLETMESTQSVDASSDSARSAVFNDSDLYGFSLEENIQTYDDSLRKLDFVQIPTNGPVTIVACSTEMFNAPGDTEYCNKAFYIKIEINGSQYIVFGRDIYVPETDKTIYAEWNSKNYELFPITNFKQGASDSTGLTGCEDYSLVMIHCTDNNRYDIIRLDETRKDPSVGELYIAALAHDDGMSETLAEAHENGSILSVKVNYDLQDGSGSYYLHISDFKTYFQAEMTKRTLFEE